LFKNDHLLETKRPFEESVQIFLVHLEELEKVAEAAQAEGQGPTCGHACHSRIAIYDL